MQSLRVACVIPTYNGRWELERLLDSLAIQTATFDTLTGSPSIFQIWRVAP